MVRNTPATPTGDTAVKCVFVVFTNEIVLIFDQNPRMTDCSADSSDGEKLSESQAYNPDTIKEAFPSSVDTKRFKWEIKHKNQTDPIRINKRDK